MSAELSRVPADQTTTTSPIPASRVSSAGGDTRADHPIRLDTDPTMADISPTMLGQATYWRARTDGGHLQLVRLDDLNPGHRRRILAWLRRNAHLMHAKEVGLIHSQYLAGRMHEYDYSVHMQALHAAPEVWLEDTALVRRLVQLVGVEPAPLRRWRILPARLRRRWWR